MRSNHSQLHQCNGGSTPLRRAPLEGLLSKHDYDRWESFLRGEIEILVGLDLGTSEWLGLFKGIKKEIEDVDMTISMEQVV